MASSKECPVWVHEKKVQQIKAEQGCSFPEARRLATADTQPVRSTAAVVKSSATNANARKMVNRADQTDLTLPLAASNPVAITKKHNWYSISDISPYWQRGKWVWWCEPENSISTPRTNKSGDARSNQPESRNTSGENMQKRKHQNWTPPPSLLYRKSGHHVQ